MSTPLICDKLAKASSKLHDICLYLRVMDTSPSRLGQPLEWVNFTSLADTAIVLSFNATKLAHSEFVTLRMAESLSIGVDQPAKKKKNKRGNEKATDFPRFRELPTELQLMIWVAAARPPRCAHYLKTIRKRQTGLRLMEDKGMWSACYDSRDAMRKAYRKACRRRRKIDCSKNDKVMEMYYQQVAQFNNDLKRFKRQVQIFEEAFRAQDADQLPILSRARDELYNVAPEPDMDEDGNPQHEVCEELGWLIKKYKSDGKLDKGEKAD